MLNYNFLVNKFINANQLPHLLFYGPPGTGKTSTILACAKQMYTPQQFNSMVSNHKILFSYIYYLRKLCNILIL